MFVGLKDWGKNSVVFGVDFEDGRGTRDFVLERKFDEGFSTENVFLRAAAAAYFWFVPLACANEQDLDIDLPMLYLYRDLPPALASLWKAMLHRERLSRISFSRTVHADLFLGSFEKIRRDIEEFPPEEVTYVLPFSAGLDSCNTLSRLLKDGVQPVLMTVNNEGVPLVWSRHFRHAHFSCQHIHQLVPEEMLSRAPLDNVTGYAWYSGFCPLVAAPPMVYIITRPCQYHLWYRQLRELLVPAVNPAIVHLTIMNDCHPSYLFQYQNRRKMWREVLTDHPEWGNRLSQLHDPPPADGIYDAAVSGKMLLELAAAGIAPDALQWKEGWEESIPWFTESWYSKLAEDPPELARRNIDTMIKFYKPALTSEVILGSQESMDKLRRCIKKWYHRMQPLRKKEPERWPPLPDVQIDDLCAE